MGAPDMRVAVVGPGYGDPWNERHVLVRRVAGALACSADVDVLLPGIDRVSTFDGAVRLFRFPATLPDRTRRRAWRTALLGEWECGDHGFRCSCASPGQAAFDDLPRFAEEQIIRADGGDSDELNQALGQGDYDVVVLVGYDTAAACFGLRHVPARSRLVLVPGALDDRTLGLSLHDEAFARAERIVVWSTRERGAVEQRGASPDKIRTLDFVLGVNWLATTTEPHDFERHHYVVVAADWTTIPDVKRLEWLAGRLEAVNPDLRLRIVGPGAGHFPLGIRLTTSRLDVWRWVSRSVCLFDPTRSQLLGLPALEAMLFGVPVVVHANGGVARDHAETGNGGLWYRTDDEFLACVAALLDGDLRESLGAEGRRYATENFTDTDGFIKSVTHTMLG